MNALRASTAVAEAVRAIRRRRGWTQEELVRRLIERRDPEGNPVESEMQIQTGTLAKLEAGARAKGKKSISIDEVLALAAALEVSPVDLVAPEAVDYVIVGGWAAPRTTLRDWLLARSALPIQDVDAFQEEHRWIAEMDQRRIDAR